MSSLRYQVCYRARGTLIVGRGVLRALPGIIRKGRYTSIVVATDTRVGRLHAKQCSALIRGMLPVHTVALPPGERSKDMRCVERLLDVLQKKKVDRHGLMIALGGGVIGDLAGFAASMYLRGIDYIQVPTSLMAQVDSAIGGKTGVDFHGIKNAVGSFYHPKAIVCDTAFLETLPHAELVNGMAEVIKYGLIGSSAFTARMQGASFARMPWEEVVGFCAHMKARTVESDPFDRKGQRALLNFGHTIGHALESLSGFLLPHGKAIAIGMLGAARISEQLLGLRRQECETIEALLKQYGLPTRLPRGTNIPEVIKVLHYDKKAKGGKVGWVLLQKIGRARAGCTVSRRLVNRILQAMV